MGDLFGGNIIGMYYSWDIFFTGILGTTLDFNGIPHELLKMGFQWFDMGCLGFFLLCSDDN